MSQRKDNPWGYAQLGRGRHYLFKTGAAVARVPRKDIAKWFIRSDLLRAMGRFSAREALYARTFGIFPEGDLAASGELECVVPPGDGLVPPIKARFTARKRAELVTDFRLLWHAPSSAISSFTDNYGPLIENMLPIPIPVSLVRLESFLFDVFVVGLKGLHVNDGSKSFNHRIESVMAAKT